MYIVEDTRNKVGEHELKAEHFANNDVMVHRCKLPVGDYALFPTVSIDTKKNIAEIAANIGGKEHARFREECKLAKAFGCRLVILVENTEGVTCVDDLPRWNNPRIRYDKRSITGERLAKAMHTMTERYGVEFMFCHPIEAGAIIERILHDAATIYEDK